MTEDNKRENVRGEWSRAERVMQEARLLFENALFEGAVSRAYYCVFHAAQALLLTDGLEAKSHGGVAHLVNLHFVRTGRLDPNVARYLAELQADRSAADYDAASVYTSEIAGEKLERANAFLDAARGLITTQGYLR